jgi:hypothetical protein
MIEAACTSETLVSFNQTTRCNNPEDSHLHTPRRENVKSHWFLMLSEEKRSLRAGCLGRRKWQQVEENYITRSSTVGTVENLLYLGI